MRRPDPDSPEARGGAATVVPAGPPGTGRVGLDRRRILGAALEYIDRNGLGALTMRRLGAHLGVEAMALYRYVPGREQLLDGVVETVIDELYGDPGVPLRAAHGWQDFLQRLAHGVRRIALAHPEVFPLVATRPPAPPPARPPPPPPRRPRPPGRPAAPPAPPGVLPPGGPRPPRRARGAAAAAQPALVESFLQAMTDSGFS